MKLEKNVKKRTKKKQTKKKMIKKRKPNCIGSHSIATDKGHSSKYPTLSVAMHKPTDEYFGGYETGFFSSKLHFIKLKC